MKKVIIGLVAISTMCIATAFTTRSSAPAVEKFDCKYGQCAAIKDNGYRCRNCAQEGSAYCWSHNHQ